MFKFKGPNPMEVKYTLMVLEEVIPNLRKAFQDGARDLIEKFDEVGHLSDYEFELATDLVMIGSK